MAGRGGKWVLSLVALVVGLLVMVPQTMQLRMDHPLYWVLQRLNENEGPFLAIILPNSASAQKLFLESGYFQPSADNPILTIHGRTFNIGKFRGMNTISTSAGNPLANVAATVQILLEHFQVLGIITYGTSGTTTDKLAIPNVAIPTHVAYAGVWSWQEYERSMKGYEKTLPSLKFGDYNLPQPGENELSSIEYQQVTKYTPKGAKQNTFWFYVDPQWLNIANEIEGSMLERCINGTRCSERVPEIVRGLRTASSDMYVSNVAYANFLRDKLNIAAVDTASTAVVTTAVANGVPHIVFRAASNRPGVPKDSKLSSEANENVLKVVAAFVDRLSQKVQPHISMY